MTPRDAGVLLVLVATAAEGFGQVCLKRGAGPGAGLGWKAGGLLLFGVETVLYTWALRYLDVSVAFPLGGLSFAVVALLSQRLLHERVDRVRWMGVLFIVAGAGLVAVRP